MRKMIFIGTAAVFVLGSLAGCSSTQVKRVNTEETIDLSGLWNDTDSRLIAAEMIDDCLRSPWINQFQQKSNRPPVVIVGMVKNQSHEHVNSDVFTKDLERSLLNSGRVQFVASKGERIEVREERDEQQKGFTDPETVKKIGKETGADFILIGSLNSVKDEIQGRYVILYQANLELVNLENNQKVWIGQTHLKKLVKRTKYSL
jgi:penicillin-binding protein activator